MIRPFRFVRFSLRNRCALAVVALAAGLLLVPATSAQATGRMIFVANNGNLEGSVTAFTVHDDGTLAFVNRVITGTRPNLSTPCLGCNPYEISISPSGRYLATGHASSNDPTEQITVFEVAADGSIAEILAKPVPGTPMDVAWIADDLLAATRTDPNPNLVDVYRFNPAGPSLTLLDSKTAGTFCVYLAVHPSHNYLYANDSGSQNMLRTFRVEANDTLTLIDSDNCGSTYDLELAVTHDGTKLYSAGGITYKLLGFSIQPDGTLTPMAGSPFPSNPGSSPSHVAVSGNDAFLLVGHGTDGSVRSYAIDPVTGALTYTGHVFIVGMQGSVGAVHALDDLFFVTNNSTYGVYSFTLNADGSFTQHGGLYSTQGIAPRGIAVWKPSFQPGDLNCDGAINPFDIDPFILALTDPAAYANAHPNCNYMLADVNGDGAVNPFDIDPFIAVLTGP